MTTENTKRAFTLRSSWTQILLICAGMAAVTVLGIIGLDIIFGS